MDGQREDSQKIPEVYRPIDAECQSVYKYGLSMNSILRFNIAIAAFAILFTALSSCELGKDDDVSDKQPDTTAWGVHQVTVTENGRIEITADKVEKFNEEDTSHFYSTVLSETNSEGELVLEGGADYVEVHGTEEGMAAGNVYINDVEEGSEIKADSMQFNDEDRILNGNGNIEVDLGDGLTMTGNSFTADLAKKTYSFTNDVKGTIEFSDDE